MGVYIRGYNGREYVACAQGLVSATRLAAETDPPEPVALDDLKAHLRWTHTEEDDLLVRYLRAARQKVERDTGVALVEQRWRITVIDFPVWRQPLILPIWPVRTIDSFSYYDGAGALQPFSASPVPYLLAEGRPTKVGLQVDEDWPTDVRRFQPGVLELTAGYEDPNTVPEDLKQAIRLLVAQNANFREPIVFGPGVTVNSVQMDYDRWIAPWILPSA